MVAALTRREETRRRDPMKDYETGLRREQRDREKREAAFIARVWTVAGQYPDDDKDLLAGLISARPELTGLEAAKARRLLIGFREGEPKRGWQDLARAILHQLAAAKAGAVP